MRVGRGTRRTPTPALLGAAPMAEQAVLADGDNGRAAVIELQVLVDDFLAELRRARAGDRQAQSYVAGIRAQIPDALVPAFRYLTHEAAGATGPCPTPKSLGEARGFEGWAAEASGQTQVFDCAALIAHAMREQNGKQR